MGGAPAGGDAIHAWAGDIDGWLEPGDSRKLYELGAEAEGPFLEIGSYRGRSTAILTRALRDSGRHVDFYSLDIDPDALASAHATLAGRGLDAHVTLVRGSVTAFFRAHPALRPRFVFIDGDHSAKGVGRDLAALEGRVPEGGLLLFHDFTDGRNPLPEHKDFGVTQAIADSWVARDCTLVGVYGCSGLYRRERASAAPAAGAAVLDLAGLDRLAVRLRIGVARPLKRRLLGRLRQPS